MALVKLKALKMRYHDNKRIREGQQFMYDEKLLKFDSEDNLIAPKYCEIVGEYKQGKKPKAPVKTAVVEEVAKDSEEVI